ncbi:chac2 [Symbiodinium natans]|uniref:glutathione-specific gamma-glutamylcyclotransferase n=1 Tax=Symbiodinium natans TaxID=878477 RepID=A0A812HCL3_9DINO|nr:chac2 [Symbiodinium natans]
MRMIAGRRLLTHQRQLVHTSLAVTAILVVRFQSTPIAFSVPRMQQPALIEPEQCEEVAFDCWERAHVDENISSDEFAKARTVFGYGSLIFRPGFPYKRMYPACVRGYLRRFWQMSCDHRGTPESPGRVLALLRTQDVSQIAGDGEDVVFGMAFEVDAADWQDVLETLDIRERHGYTRTLTRLYPVSSDGHDELPSCGEAVIYYTYNPECSAAYAGPESVEASAKVIARAVGPSGPNDEYLFSLVEAA